MQQPMIVRPDDCQPAHALWYDRKHYVTVNFMIQKPKNVQVDIQGDKMILCCKSEDNTIYNEFYFYDRVLSPDSRARVYDRSINVILRKITANVSWPRLQKDTAKPIWINTDFDNWRDWENEEEEGMAEYDDYLEMIADMGKNKAQAPAMDDLSDLDDD